MRLSERRTFTRLERYAALCALPGGGSLQFAQSTALLGRMTCSGGRSLQPASPSRSPSLVMAQTPAPGPTPPTPQQPGVAGGGGGSPAQTTAPGTESSQGKVIGTPKKPGSFDAQRGASLCPVVVYRPDRYSGHFRSLVCLAQTTQARLSLLCRRCSRAFVAPVDRSAEGDAGHSPGEPVRNWVP